MATEVLLPKLGFSMNEGVLAEWLVADGAHVTAGQPLYSLESDKSVQEVESPGAPRLLLVRGDEGVDGPAEHSVRILES